MSIGKETAVQQVRSAKKIELLLGLIGVPIGYAISYWFQPEFLRVKCPLGQYFVHVKDIIGNKDTAPTAIIVTLIVAALFDLIGKWMTSRTKLCTSEPGVPISLIVVLIICYLLNNGLLANWIIRLRRCIRNIPRIG